MLLSESTLVSINELILSLQHPTEMKDFKVGQINVCVWIYNYYSQRYLAT